MDRDTVLQRLRALKPRFDAMNIKRLSLFGSHARGDAGPGSDVDLLIEFAHRPAGLIALAKKKREIESHMGVPVDLITFDALTKARHDKILSEAIDV